MSKPSKPVREIPFEEIEKRFLIDIYGPGPGVGRRSIGGYYIRITKSIQVSGLNETRKFDYFFTAEDGTVTTAPRGYAKDYRPGRITGIVEALLKYAVAPS